MNWYLNVLKNYVTFSGRARRKEFWMFTLIHVVVIFALLMLFGSTQADAFYYLYLAYLLGTLLPTIAVTVRRLHDTNRSGGWYFISFVPIIGSFWLLALLTTAGDRQANMYGADPKVA
ncbi:DUF805 domain-containing protein [Catellatospora bangladeshensis]|uniref:Inner membrane protein YhaI n=1 Tax=Catellatospora bangladeshensis TaxID=310355 RepID=A0A8J3JL26_9ACTN|nr:DUF805 domain-containing protein [Catellatospora bangladeshensis]GIF82583.1 inner membrane protein YhaI [Catellatospora bangladeshensis]